MTRVVRGADGRIWTLHGEMEWRTPATADDFEHDVSAGHTAAVVMLVLVLILTVVLIVWTPPDVVVPLWLVLIILLVVLFFPLRWSLRRPWTIVAATGDSAENDESGLPKPTEKWVGTVRGVLNVRKQVANIARSIADDSIPDAEGPLKPVD
jgi:uncharacterized protein (DUF983 family)